MISRGIEICRIGQTCTALGILLATLIADPQQRAKSAFIEVQGNVAVGTTHVRWSSPEAVVRDLRSSDLQTRLRALLLLGFTDDQAHVETWSQVSPAKDMGKTVVTPDQIQLTYASLGEDSTQQAILAVQINQRQDTYVAVAEPIAGGWERIATSGCWCKYETDPLAEFVQLGPAPNFTGTAPAHYELVLRSSGGGTGLYQQDEARFRVRGGELREVISFTSRSRNCNNGSSSYGCRVVKRWFGSENVEGAVRYVLIEGGGSTPGNAPPAIWSFRELEDSYLKHFTCSSFQWNEKLLRYERLKEKPDPCEASLSKGHPE